MLKELASLHLPSKTNFYDKYTEGRREETEYVIRVMGEALVQSVTDVCLKRPVDPVYHISEYIRNYGIKVEQYLQKKATEKEVNLLISEETEQQIKLYVDYLITRGIDIVKEKQRRAEEELRLQAEREAKENCAVKETTDRLFEFIGEDIEPTLDIIEEENRKKRLERLREEEAARDRREELGEEEQK